MRLVKSEQRCEKINKKEKKKKILADREYRKTRRGDPCLHRRVSLGSKKREERARHEEGREVQGQCTGGKKEPKYSKQGSETVGCARCTFGRGACVSQWPGRALGADQRCAG